MHGVSEKLSYQIQRADFATTEFGPVDLAEALTVLREHDWRAEFHYKKSLESGAKETCPPGIYFNTTTRHQLHICPQQDGTANCYYRFQNDFATDVWLRVSVLNEQRDQLVESFFRGEYAMVTRVLTRAVWHWIRRADMTYSPGTDAISLTEAQSLLRNCDWNSELSRQHELEVAKKDCCSPGIGFAGEAGFLHFNPNGVGTVDAYLWDITRQRGWGCGGLGPDEQSRILDLFYRGDSGLTRDWYEYEVEAYTDERGRQLTRGKTDDTEGWMRATWLAMVKQTRARRGQPPELTEEERNLSEHDARALHLREARLEEEERNRQESISAVRSSRKWSLIIGAAGTLLAAILYSGVLQAWISEQRIKDLWAWSLMMTGGLVIGVLQHLELTALVRGTIRARKQADFAKALCGTVLFIVGSVCVALALAFVLAMVEPWLHPHLPSPLGNLLPTLSDRQFDRFLVASGVMLAVIALTIGSAFAWRRAANPAESWQASIAAVGGICLGSFTVVAVGPFLLMFPVFVASTSLMALNFGDAGTWLNNNFAFATILILPGTGVLTTALYLYGRWRAPEWESKPSTLIGAGLRAAGILVFGSMGLFALAMGAASLKAHGILGG